MELIVAPHWPLCYGAAIHILAATIIVGSFRFFLAWNQIVRLNRPTSLLQAAVNTFVYQRCPKMKQEPSDECPICLAESVSSIVIDIESIR
jgi:hypothetical protein